MATKGALKQLLRERYRYNSAISMQWILFGSAKHQERPAQGQLAGFDRCTGQLSKQMKCLGNTYWLHGDSIFRPTHVHQCTLKCVSPILLGALVPYRVLPDRLVPGPP